MKRVGRFIAGSVALILASTAYAGDLPGEGLAGWKISFECPRGKIERNVADGSITFCVPEMTSDIRRCEVALTGPDVRRQHLNLQFDVKLNDAAARPSAPIIIFQIHSRPDPGEVWRCPMAAMRSLPGATMDSGGAYDPNKISKPSPGVCMGPGSSIQGYRLPRGAGFEPGKWSKLNLQYRLALDDEGAVEVYKDGNLLGRHNGPNIFNDASPPSLKMGVYGEPSGQLGPICSTVRNIKISIRE